MYLKASPKTSLARPLARLGLLALALPLSACNMVVMKPSGDIANQQAQLIVASTLLMLLIIVPVIILTLVFAFRYRASNTQATYSPEWDHSTRLELIIWGAPLLIIIALGAMTWISTHKLDPFRPLERLDAQRAIPAGVQPLTVEVVALDWKWLFIYPEQGIATVNELAAPVDRALHAVINKPGVYDGFSANFSGDGFSHMRFKFHGLSNDEFSAWVERNKADGVALTKELYLDLEKPSERQPVRRFASVAPGLFDAVVNRCVDGTKMCMGQMMAIDAAGGGGKGAIDGLASKPWSNEQKRIFVAALCTPDNAGQYASQWQASATRN